VGLAYLPTIVYMHFIVFIVISLISGCGHRTEDKEESMQSVSVEGVSLLVTPKAGSSIQNTHLCHICIPVLKHILHLTAPPVQRFCLFVTCADLPQHQNHKSAEKTLKRDIDWTSFLKSFEFCESGKQLNCEDLWKDYPDLLELLWLQVIPNTEKPNYSEFGEAHHHGKSDYKLFECRKVSNHKNMIFHNLRIYTEKKNFSQCEKLFLDEYSLAQNHSVHIGERSYECK
jgi:hypothetical protein